MGGQGSDVCGAEVCASSESMQAHSGWRPSHKGKGQTSVPVNRVILIVYVIHGKNPALGVGDCPAGAGGQCPQASASVREDRPLAGDLRSTPYSLQGMRRLGRAVGTVPVTANMDRTACVWETPREHGGCADRNAAAGSRRPANGHAAGRLQLLATLSAKPPVRRQAAGGGRRVAPPCTPTAAEYGVLGECACFARAADASGVPTPIS